MDLFSFLPLCACVCVTVCFVCVYTVRVQVFEETGLSRSLLAQVFIPAPETSAVSGQVPPEEFEFSSTQTVMFDHEGVGSGTFLSYIFSIFLNKVDNRLRYRLND